MGDNDMTLRDRFAGLALGSVIQTCGGDSKPAEESIEQMFARKAYAIADAMLAERVFAAFEQSNEEQDW